MNPWFWYRAAKGEVSEGEVVARFVFPRFLFACFGLLIGVVAAIGFAVYRVFSDLSRELDYRQKYGANWQAEFEKYHGSLSDMHTRIAVCTACVLAMVAILAWLCHKLFRKHTKRHYERSAP